MSDRHQCCRSRFGHPFSRSYHPNGTTSKGWWLCAQSRKNRTCWKERGMYYFLQSQRTIFDGLNWENGQYSIPRNCWTEGSRHIKGSFERTNREDKEFRWGTGLVLLGVGTWVDYLVGSRKSFSFVSGTTIWRKDQTSIIFDANKIPRVCNLFVHEWRGKPQPKGVSLVPYDKTREVLLRRSIPHQQLDSKIDSVRH